MRRRIGLVSCALFGLLVLAAVPLWFGYRAMRHDRANHALAAALWKNDTAAALAALNEGADPNIHCGREEQIEAHVSLTMLFRRFLDSLTGKRAVAAKAVEPYALIVATSSQNDTTVQALLDRGANVNARDEEGETPLIVALLYRNEALIELILKYGANVNIHDKNGATALLMAVQSSNPQIASALLDKGADINAKNKLGETALMLAAQDYHPEIVKLLLDSGADVKTQGYRALAWAIHGVPHMGGLPLTLREVDAQDAATLATTKLLLNRGVSVRTSGDNILCEAIYRQSAEVVKLLLDSGADVNAKDSDGTPPLIEAVRTGDISTVKLLLNRGADVHAKNDDDETALMVAREYHRNDIEALLEKAGAKR